MKETNQQIEVFFKFFGNDIVLGCYLWIGFSLVIQQQQIHLLSHMVDN
jgi:hypothetical protein